MDSPESKHQFKNPPATENTEDSGGDSRYKAKIHSIDQAQIDALLQLKEQYEQLQNDKIHAKAKTNEKDKEEPELDAKDNLEEELFAPETPKTKKRYRLFRKIKRLLDQLIKQFLLEYTLLHHNLEASEPYFFMKLGSSKALKRLLEILYSKGLIDQTNYHLITRQLLLPQIGEQIVATKFALEKLQFGLTKLLASSLAAPDLSLATLALDKKQAIAEEKRQALSRDHKSLAIDERKISLSDKTLPAQGQQKADIFIEGRPRSDQTPPLFPTLFKLDHNSVSQAAAPLSAAFNFTKFLTGVLELSKLLEKALPFKHRGELHHHHNHSDHHHKHSSHDHEKHHHHDHNHHDHHKHPPHDHEKHHHHSDHHHHDHHHPHHHHSHEGDHDHHGHNHEHNHDQQHQHGPGCGHPSFSTHLRDAQAENPLKEEIKGFKSRQ